MKSPLVNIKKFKMFLVIFGIFFVSNLLIDFSYSWDDSLDMWHNALEIKPGHFSGGRFFFDDGLTINDTFNVLSNSSFYSTITVHGASIVIQDDLVVGDVSMLTNQTYIDGVLITSTPQELNLLDGTSVLVGGIMFGDGTKITQKPSMFFWDNTNNKLGIGTNSPSDRLTIKGGNLTLRSDEFPTQVIGGIKYSDLGIGLISVGSFGTTSELALYSANQEAMRIDDEGKVGVGTTNPSYDLDVVGDQRITNNLIVEGVAHIANLNVSGFTILKGTNATDFLFDGTGNVSQDLVVGGNTLYVDSENNRVGINTMNPTDSLQVIGTTKLQGNVQTTSKLSFNQLNPNGAICGINQTVSIGDDGQWKCVDFVENQDEITVYVFGFTNTLYNGNLGGYDGANAKCNNEYPGTHICTVQEMLNTINYYDYKNILDWTGTVWFSGGPPGYTANANDCKGFTSSDASVLGRFWNLDETNFGGMAWLTSCAQNKKLACCK